MLLTSASVGLESLAIAASTLILENLDDELDAQQIAWEQVDKDFAAARGVAYERVKLEKILPENIHKGHKPSLIEAPVERYPNVSCMAYQGGTSSDHLDQLDNYEILLFVEIMCKAMEEEASDPEELLNSRTTRTLDAIVNIFAKNPTLGGLVKPVAEEPDASIMNLFKRSEHTSSGAPFLWQGARLDYAFEKISDF